MDDDTRYAPSGTDKLGTPRPATFEEIAALAAHNPLPRGGRLERVDDTGDQITAWLDALSRWLPANN